MFTYFIYSTLCVDESLFNSLSIYQVMVSSFQDGDPNVGYRVGYGPSHHKGDLRGIINSLKYIRDLGFNTLWMTPIFDSSNGQGGSILQSTGYFATNYFKVDPKFGNEDVLRELISKAHSLGLYVLLDGVFGHTGGVKQASPNGNWPRDSTNPVQYPGSLPYFQEVAKYWIENFEIDGWRLDQCYQMYQNGHNYLKELRETVYQVCDERRAQGKEWGILGYMVGEDWEGLDKINTHSYGGDGIRSAFDFPHRYKLVQSTAQEESGGYNDDSDRINVYSNVLRPPNEKGYPSNVYPNLFLDNHDLFRFGNLIRERYGFGKKNDNYWKYHKIGIATLAVYTGPVTLYYGNEIGDITDCWYKNYNNCSSNTALDNCARTNGQISGFDDKQQDLHDFTSALLNARLNHPAMWRGSYNVTKDYNTNTYFNCKYDSQTKDKILFVFSFNWNAQTVKYSVGGVKLVDLVSGEILYENGGKYSIYLNGLEPRVFQVLDIPIPTETPKPSQSPSPTPSQSPLPTPSQSPLPTPSQSPLPTPSQSPLPTRSPTPSPLPTPSYSPLPTRSPTPMPTQSPTPSQTYSPEEPEGEIGVETADSTEFDTENPERSHTLIIVTIIISTIILLIPIIICVILNNRKKKELNSISDILLYAVF